MNRPKIYRARKRHIVKAISWRAVGTLDTVLIAWFVTGSPKLGLSIGVVELVTKTVLYYFHERIWFNVNVPESNKRHILKTFTWRMVGTIDTMLIAWAISGNPLTGFKIGGAEAITKMILYYLHERAWHTTHFGLEPIENEQERI